MGQADTMAMGYECPFFQAGQHIARALRGQSMLCAGIMRQATTAQTAEAAGEAPDWGRVLARVAAQDKAAFGNLYDYFAPRIKGWSLKMGAPASKAEDIVQDVMLQIWRRAAQFDPARADAGTWIFAITRNRYIDLVRQEKRPEIAMDDPIVIASDDATPEEALRDRERADRVAAALAQLPEAQRAIIRQSYFAELTQQEIATQDGVPLGTVKSRLRLAFGRLRELLGDVA